MHSIEPIRENGYAIAAAMMDALVEDNLDEAEVWLECLREMNQLSPDHPDILTFSSLIAIQRGQATEALCHFNSLPDDTAPDLKVMCMYFAQDPTWEGTAHELADHSADPEVRRSMSQFLGREFND